MRTFDDELAGVQADVVHQLEGSHRVAGAELHRGVDVLLAGVAALRHADRLEHVRHQEAVHDEAGRVLKVKLCTR